MTRLARYARRACLPAAFLPAIELRDGRAAPVGGVVRAGGDGTYHLRVVASQEFIPQGQPVNDGASAAPGWECL